ncbi:hypothetical protein PHLGIDRAFT_225101 [Phlebiopsis gigantea 11061_1 CR5-6]|uniref:Helicase ATP-binding domain-containing protein n=1 Tax=Phlebiopsis gigantea (strain 11061_1 CR5-6) TaxID=745531 RepID=A0A0C3S2C6_PHLG1|nr:hypothetical protein PHLGIDRAFT_225101 [Phlebiopsis gigantea 11061_1 CR5-6]
MTPWMLSILRMRQLLNDKDIKPLFRWFFADEVHLFNEEGSVWRVVYQAIKYMRERLPSSTIWGAFTATASISKARTIAAGVVFHSGDYADTRYTLDRPNLKYIARMCCYPVLRPLLYSVDFSVSQNHHRCAVTKSVEATSSLIHFHP